MDDRDSLIVEIYEMKKQRDEINEKINEKIAELNEIVNGEEQDGPWKIVSDPLSHDAVIEESE